MRFDDLLGDCTAVSAPVSPKIDSASDSLSDSAPHTGWTDWDLSERSHCVCRLRAVALVRMTWKQSCDAAAVPEASGNCLGAERP
jgi:hypothetical protein